MPLEKKTGERDQLLSVQADKMGGTQIATRKVPPQQRQSRARRRLVGAPQRAAGDRQHAAHE